MPLRQQSYIQSLLNECDAYYGREQKQAKQAVILRLKEVYRKLKQNIKDSFTNYSQDVFVRFMQIAVEVDQRFQNAQEFIQLYFQRIQAPSQFYIRALLVKAKYITYKGHKSQYKGQAMISILKDSIAEINRALDLIAGPQQGNVKGKDSKGGGQGSSKQKYSFLIYNASTCLYKITRFILRQHWMKNFTDIYQRVYKLFEEVNEPDQSWRCKFTLVLFQCLYDNDKKADAWKILDLLWQRAKKQNWQSLDSLFRLRVHYSKQNNALSGTIKKDVQGNDPNGWRILQTLQRMKSGSIPQAQIQKQLMGVVNQISLGVLSTGEQSASIALPHIMQLRLGQAGRIALKFQLINIATSITNFLSKARQPNQKAMVLNEYNKAQLMIKKKGQYVDKKTGMIMSANQIKQVQIQSRKQALKVLQKVMIINKKLDNPQLIYEGSILIWNIGLPFMCPQYKNYIAKAFDISCSLLQQIGSVDHDLRTKMHLQLANIYFGNEQMFPQVQKNILKAIKLDHSIPVSKIQFKFQPEEDPSLYHRPYERYLSVFRQKIMLKTMKKIDPDELDIIVTDLWNVVQQKSQTTRIDILQKCLRVLLNLQQQQYKVDEKKMLVEEQIKEQKIEFQRQKLRKYKRKKMLAAQITQLAFEWQINDFAKKAGEFVLADTWQGKNALQLIIAQAKCSYFLGQIKIDQLNQQNYQVPFTQVVLIQKDQTKQDKVSEEVQKRVGQKKKLLFQYFNKGLQLSESIQQHWLIFNGAIYIWNNFLQVFRNPINDSKLHPDLCQLLKKLYQTMKNSLKEIQTKNIVYYDLDTKIQTFANISIVYARLMQQQKQTDEVIKICDTLLLTQLSPHSRKLINSIKARVGGGKAGGGGKAQKKGGKQVAQEKSGGYNDSFLFQIFSQLEIIQNSTNKNQTQGLIKKCFQNLQSWQPKQKDQTQLQLHAQLWARLSRLALNQGNVTMYKYALRCAQYSLSLQKTDKKTINIPANRIRWYSLAQFLYSQSLLYIANPETQETESYEKLLFAALDHAVQATRKGYQSNINALVVDASKQVWNICIKLQQSQKNRAKLLIPLKTTLFYLKQMKQQNQIDLILLLSQLFFRSAMQNNQYKMGQQVADMMFILVPKNLQKSIWQAKMVFMSKQGKNQLQAISNMKQADPSLQAKLWVKLARVANQVRKQHAAYTKAIQILKKQNSVQIVQVLIEYAQWQLRVGGQKVQTVIENLLFASDQLIDIQFGDDDEDGQFEDEKGTVFSRSTRGKKSQASKSIKSSVTKQGKMKKLGQKKGQSSNKSKAGSGMSRMNRSSRITKTIKSKNSKSIFSQREQDPNPDTLNCTHFERLFRIHTILALISQTALDRIRYALDAKHFLIKILEISFKTINQLQDNSVRFSQNNAKNEGKKYNIPSSIEQWLNLELSKQFIDKIKILQDSNFMGSYSFDKPELTYTYMRHLSRILNNFGLNIHSIPIYFFQKFIAKQILSNDDFYKTSQVQLLLCLRKINYHDDKKPQLTKIDFSLYSLSQTSKKTQFAKSQSKIVQDREDQTLFQTSYPPNLIKTFTSHQSWLQTGKLLIQFGQIHLAKIYICEAMKNFQILGNIQLVGVCNIHLAQIADFEGQKKQALQYSMMANKMCKNSVNWQKLLKIVSKVLISLQKYEDIQTFGFKIYETVNQMILDCKKQKNEKCIFESQIIDLKSILILIQIINIDLNMKEIFHDNLQQGNKNLLKSISHIQQRISNDSLWKISHYKYFLQLSSQIINSFIFGKDKTFSITSTVFNKLLSLLLQVQKNIFQLMKYSIISSVEQFQKNPIIKLYRKYRFIIAEAYIYQSTLTDQSIYGQSQQVDTVNQIAQKNQILQSFMNTLNVQIQKKMSKIPTNLPPIQSSIAILQNLKANIDQGSYQQLQWQVHNIRSLTIRAKQQLQNVWLDNNNDDNMQDKAAQSLQALLKFINEDKQKQLLDYSKNNKCYELGQKLYESLVQNMGQQLSEKYFEYLSKMQHCSYLKQLIDIVHNNLEYNHRLISFLKLSSQTCIQKQIINQTLSKNKLYSSLIKFPTYQQCISLLPKNSVYVILQLSNDKTHLYFGCLINQKVQDQYKQRIIAKKRPISKIQLKAFSRIRINIKKIQKTLSYLAYQDPQKLKNQIEKMQQLLQKTKSQLNDKCLWWVKQLLYLLNNVKQQQQTINQTDKNKKGGKQTKKKGKQDVASYQSPLGTTPAGFQSVTFLVDDFFEGIPFESLQGLDKVPAISYDSSLFFLSRKMQNIGYKSDANNSNGFGADKGKYISYDFKEQKMNFKKILEQINKVSPTLKFDGISSNTKIPSIGDYYRYLTQNGFLHVYGINDFLNHIKVPVLLQHSGITKCKLLIINDHLNYRKSVMNKFISLDDKARSNSLNQEFKILKGIANLLDMNMIKNRWPSEVDKFTNGLINMYKNLGAGYYLGAINNKQDEQNKDQLIDRNIFEVHGCPVLRM